MAGEPNTSYDPAAPAPVGGTLEQGDIIVDTLADCLVGRYFVVMDLVTGESRWSASAVRDLGLPGPVIRDTTAAWGDHIHPDDRDTYLAEASSILKSNENHYFIQFRARRADGEYSVFK